MFTSLDIAERDGFLIFAQVHFACFGILLGSETKSARGKDMLGEMVDALDKDLRRLGSTEHRVPRSTGMNFDPLALDYMVGGSRLGTKILRKRWAATLDPKVQDADTYFNLTSDPNYWRETCDALADITVDGPRAQRILNDTQAMFGLFEARFQLLQVPERALA